MSQVGHERFEAGLGRRQDSLGHAFGVNARCGDRVAQFVGDVGNESPSQHLGLFERVGHAVERVAESCDFCRPGRLDAVREIACGEAFRRGLERADGPAQVPRQQDGDDCGDEDGDDGADVDAAVDACHEGLLGGAQYHPTHAASSGHAAGGRRQAREIGIERGGEGVSGDEPDSEHRAERDEEDGEEDLEPQAEVTHPHTSTL